MPCQGLAAARVRARVRSAESSVITDRCRRWQRGRAVSIRPGRADGRGALVRPQAQGGASSALGSGNSLLPWKLYQLWQVIVTTGEFVARVGGRVCVLAGFGCDAPPGLGGEALPAVLVVGWLAACVLRLSRQVKTYREATFLESTTISSISADSASHPRAMTSAPGLGDARDANAARRSDARSSADHKPNELGAPHTIQRVLSHISAPNGSANRV